MSTPHVAVPARSRWRLPLTLAVVITPVLLLARVLPEAMREESVAEIPCWILPNLQVIAVPGNESCPVGLGQTVARAHSGELIDIRDRLALAAVLRGAGSTLRVELQEGARKQWVDIPVHVTERSTRLARVASAGIGVSLLLGVPLFLVWRSSSRAAVPLTAFYGCVSVVLVTIVTGQHSDALTRVALLALVIAPAAATHLSLVFPKERRLTQEVPTLFRLPYAFSAFLIPVGCVALERDPLLWPPFVSLLVAMTAVAWMVLILSCYFAVRESRSAIERAQARLVLYAGLLTPLLPALLLTFEARDAGQFAVAYLWSAPVGMPLPIALAIGRYNLFDLESEVRHAIARILFLGIAAFIVALVLSAMLVLVDAPTTLREPAPLFLIASVCVVFVEALRKRTLGALEALVTPQLQRLRRLRVEFEKSVSGRWDTHEIVRLLAEALERGISPGSGGIVISEAGGWRPVCSLGGRPPPSGMENEALRLLGASSIVHLAASSMLPGEAAALISSGVEAIVAIEGGGERYGLLLLGERKRQAPFTGLELDFVVALSAHAGIALRNAQITAGLIATERHAATGRIAIGLAHDVGKDLGWMRRLVKRLPENFGDPEKLARDTSMIHELTGGLADAIRRFVRDATEPPARDSGARQMEDVVDDAARRAVRLHGEGRVTQNIDPELRTLPVHPSLGRAIWNLLDNALHASTDGKPAHVVVTRDAGCVQIEIRDQGSGISEHALVRVFEPGFTTRSEAGGSGVGLPVALEIIESLGGTLELLSGPHGTCATIRVPDQR